MAIVTHNLPLTDQKILELQILQARLAKDGTDDDLKWAVSDGAIKKANVKDRTERIKHLLRLGIRAETTGVLTDNAGLLPDADDDFIFDGHDLAHAGSAIVAKIGTRTTVRGITYVSSPN